MEFCFKIYTGEKVIGFKYFDFEEYLIPKNNIFINNKEIKIPIYGYGKDIILKLYLNDVFLAQITPEHSKVIEGDILSIKENNLKINLGEFKDAISARI